MQEMQVRSLSPEDPLEKGMATHFSILAWEIPRTEEPARLQSTTKAAEHAAHTHVQAPACISKAPLKEKAKTSSRQEGNVCSLCV